MDLNFITQETITVSIVFESKYTDTAPKVEILLDKQSFYNEILPNGRCVVDFTVTLDSNTTHKLIVHRTGKTPGMDQTTKIVDVIIDRISVRDIVWHRSLYYPDYPEPWATEQKEAGVELENPVHGEYIFGHNGTWEFEFGSLFYQWLLELCKGTR
jgi:hypothetical protein